MSMGHWSHCWRTIGTARELGPGNTSALTFLPIAWTASHTFDTSAVTFPQRNAVHSGTACGSSTWRMSMPVSSLNSLTQRSQ